MVSAILCHPGRFLSILEYDYLLPEKNIKRYAHCYDKNLVCRGGQLFFNWKFRCEIDI